MLFNKIKILKMYERENLQNKNYCNIFKFLIKLKIKIILFNNLVIF